MFKHCPESHLVVGGGGALKRLYATDVVSVSRAPEGPDSGLRSSEAVKAWRGARMHQRQSGKHVT